MIARLMLPDPCWCVLEQLLPELLKCEPPHVSRETVWDELTARWPDLLRTWNPQLAPLEAYVKLSLRLYAIKSHARSTKRSQQHENRDFNNIPDKLVLDRIDKPVLEQLSPFDSQLLRLHYSEGYTQHELAMWLDCSRSQARLLIQRALQRARTYRFFARALVEVRIALLEILETA
jgi:hypothetical protein